MTGARVDNPSLGAVVAVALKPSGLAPRGWLTPETGSAPLLTNGQPAKAICLVGHGGGGFWSVFEAWRRKHCGIGEPLDTWSKATINPVAVSLGGEAVFPSDQPWHPFQQWAMIAEGLKPSPLGLLIHPEFGLWHGYRGAIMFGADVLAQSGWGEVSRNLGVNHPCDNCISKPCLTSCPVGAFTPDGLAVVACRDYLKLDMGQQGCMKSGCLARDACPVGRSYRYGAEQIRFHMTAYS